MDKVKVVITSKETNRSVTAHVKPVDLVDKYVDEWDMVQELTQCDCQPLGEAGYTECNCWEEFEEYTVEYKV
jgi:hypothetical protein